MPARCAFRTVVAWLMCVVPVSAVLHPVLLASDSDAYRAWVVCAVLLHPVALWLLWRVRGFSTPALAGLFAASALLVAIRVELLHPGSHAPVWWSVLARVLFGRLAATARGTFRERAGRSPLP